MKEALDEIALLVKLAIDASFFGSLFARRNDGFDLTKLELFQDCVRVVAAVAEARLAGEEVDEFVCDGAVVLLARRDDDLQRPAL